MAKSREKQKANKKKFREERLDLKTAFGIPDPTPKAAVERILERK